MAWRRTAQGFHDVTVVANSGERASRAAEPSSSWSGLDNLLTLPRHSLGRYRLASSTQSRTHREILQRFKEGDSKHVSQSKCARLPGSNGTDFEAQAAFRDCSLGVGRFCSAD